MHYDDDSPAGKEYALPLDEARGAGTAGASPRGEDGAAPARFGEGISRRTAAGGEAGSTSTDGEQDAGGDESAAGGSAPGAAGSHEGPAQRRALRQELSGEDSTGTVLGALVGMGAALGALAVGLGLRRRAVRNRRGVA